MRRLGGLFSGIGGFELAWQRAGGEVAWMCESDPRARRVLEARFPGVPIYEDVAELDPAEVEAVDVVSGGSPCQGFSVVGSRTGLDHAESRLFSDYIRIVDGLAERGLSYAIWENVPGVLSIKNRDGERTFPHVVAALVGAGEPVRLDTRVRWNSGMAARGRRAVSWRVVDSQHFGVPQRRRRLYACVALGDIAGDRAFSSLLAWPECSSGDHPTCCQTGPRAARGTGESAASHDRESVRSDRYSNAATRDVAHTTSAGKGHLDVMPHVLDVVPIQNAATRTNSSAKTPSPDAEGRIRLRDPGLGIGAPGDPQFTLDASSPHAVGPVLVAEDVVAAHETGHGWWWKQGHIAGTLRAEGENRPSRPSNVISVGHKGVRRITPVEAERLQGFPDDWTLPAQSDSARYRSLGNAITVNVAAWLFGRLQWGD